MITKTAAQIMQTHTEHSSQNIQKFVHDELDGLLRLKEALDLPNGHETILDQILFVQQNKSTNQKQSKQLLQYLSSNEYDTDAIKYDLIDIYNAQKKSNISNHISNTSFSDWIRNNMVKKTYKTPAMLLSECTNCLARENQMDIYSHCKSIQRIIVILKAYNRIINSKLYGKISLSNTLKFKDIYTLTEINNDYLHIKDHIDDNSIGRDKLLENIREHIDITPGIHRGARHRTTDVIESSVSNIDIVVQTTCVKIISYLTHAYNKPYIGKKEDDDWWDIDNDVDEKKDNYEMDEIIYRELIRKMKIFRWQCSHGFNSKQHQGLMHLKPRFANVKEEVLHNPYYALSKDNWNRTLRKSQVFCNSFARRNIQTSYTGKYDDKIVQKNVEWKKGETINLKDIVTLKLYTDFDKLQFELKRCFRFDTLSDIFAVNNFGSDNDSKIEFNIDKNLRLLLEQRLSIFYWWRIKLLTVLNKYSQPMNPNNFGSQINSNASLLSETYAKYKQSNTYSLDTQLLTQLEILKDEYGKYKQLNDYSLDAKLLAQLKILKNEYGKSESHCRQKHLGNISIKLRRYQMRNLKFLHLRKMSTNFVLY